MHGILSYSRFGVKGALTAPREELLDDFENIESCGASLLSLLDDLLDLAKLEAGRMRFEFAVTPLEEIVAEALDEFASFYHDRALRVDVRAENALEPVVVDRRKILQVMRNLLSNAGKFSPAGGTVWIRMASEEGRARVVVEDSGVGIPEGELELIFENFAQASNSKAQSGGTGLGLAICREVVGAHAGRIWAANRPEGGARITVELPLEGPPATSQQDILRPSDGSHGQDLSVLDSRLAGTPEVRSAA
jgi:signal transduction histidine kinase